jgi:hypothetical protein
VTPEGAQVVRYSADDFERAMELDEQRYNLFRTNTEALARKAQHALPYARVLKVQRRLPGTLRLTVTPRSAALFQKQGKQFWLLAENGLLLEAVNKRPKEKGLLEISGKALLHPEAGKSAAWKDAAASADDLEPLLATLRESEIGKSITGLKIAGAMLPDAIYDGRIRIRLGAASLATEIDRENTQAPERLQDILRRAEQVIAQLNAQNPKQHGVVDFSIAGKAYFTPDWTNF